MSLYQKHRPTKWQQVIGNKELIEYLQHEVTNDERPQAYLLTGPYGSGKTTIGRLYANALGCTGLDFQEVDSGDFRGIETIRDIRRNMQFAPMFGKVKIWLIDECHKLTGDAQSALLKALEDTPKNVYFIMVTTDPQKLLATIKSRCTPLEVQALTNPELTRLLKIVARKENFNLDNDKAEEIIEAAGGSPRNALVILEKHIAAPTAAIASSLEEKTVLDLCQGLLRRNSWGAIAKIIKQLQKDKVDVENVRRGVLGWMTTVILKSKNDQALLVIELFKDNFYDSGWAGIVWAAALSVKSDTTIATEEEEEEEEQEKQLEKETIEGDDDDIPF